MRAARSLRTSAENAPENQSSGLSVAALAARKPQAKRRASRTATPASTTRAARPSSGTIEGCPGAANCSDAKPPSQMTGSTSSGESRAGRTASR